jgi:hypothetical protein
MIGRANSLLFSFFIFLFSISIAHADEFAIDSDQNFVVRTNEQFIANQSNTTYLNVFVFGTNMTTGLNLSFYVTN